MNSDSINHLVRLAKAGQHPGASGGERRMFEIVACLLEHGYGNDCNAMAGISQLVSAIENRDTEITDRFEEISDSMSNQKHTLAHVICLNDSVECVVVDTIEAAKAKMAEVSKRYREQHPWIKDEEYEARCFWHIHTIPAVGEGLKATK